MKPVSAVRTFLCTYITFHSKGMKIAAQGFSSLAHTFVNGVLLLNKSHVAERNS